MSEINNNKLPTIRKLDGRSNYSTWKFGMENYLIGEGLWGYVDGTLTDDNKDAIAKAKINLMLEEHLYPVVTGLKKAKEVWDQLKNTYENKGLSRRLFLLRKLFKLNLNQFKSMEVYINEIMSVSQKLTAIGATVEDEFVGVIMLNGLTEDYEPMIMALDAGGTKITSDSVRTLLLQKDHNVEPEEATYFTKHKPRKEVQCYSCQNYGHVASSSFCPNKKANKYNERPNKANLSENRKQNTYFQKGKQPKKALLVALTSTVNDTSPSTDWYVDSGSTSHMTKMRDWIFNFRHESLDVAVASGENLKVKGRGDIELTNDLVIRNSLYVPDITHNLLSVNQITEKDLTVVFDKIGFKILDNKSITIAKGIKENGLYKMLLPKPSEEAFFASSSSISKASATVWHKRLGHANRYSMQLLQEKLADGIQFTDKNKKEDCVACIMGKQANKPFPTKGSRAKGILDLVHSDVAGPMSVSSWGGANYILTFTDDYTRKSFVYLMKNKSEVTQKFKYFKVMVENQTNKKIKILRTDNGTEYVNNELKNYLKECGIIHQKTIIYKPQQNGVAERLNRILVEKSLCMLHEAGLIKRYWGEAICAANYLKNRTPTKAVDNVTPEEAWSGKRINLAHLRVFGCKAYAKIPNAKRKKLDFKSREFIFVGYSEEKKGYRLIDPNNPNQITEARDVVFLEDGINDSKTNGTEVEIENKQGISEVPIIFSNVSQQEEEISTDNESVNAEPRTSSRSRKLPSKFEEFVMNTEIQGESNSKSSTDDDKVSEYSTHSKSESEGDSEVSNTSYSKFDDLECSGDSTALNISEENNIILSKSNLNYDYFSLICTEGEPSCYKSAMNAPDSKKWLISMESEYNSLIKNKTWVLVDKPNNASNIVKCKWIYKIKKDSDGKVVKYKARLVAKGCSQKAGIDYFETFSPVIRYSSLRLLFALGAKLDLEIDHLDVECAFLHGNLKETIYMQQPEGFIKSGEENKVCLLQKSIYGLKQSSRTWFEETKYVIINENFVQSSYEPCIFYKIDAKIFIVIALYVDDYFIFYNNKEECEKIKKALQNKFKIKDLGPAKLILGMNIDRDRIKNSIKLSNKNYISSMLKKFQMDNANSVGTPLETGIKLKKDSIDERFNFYQELIGSIMYLSVTCRPDIAYAASYLSQFNNFHEKSHWVAAKRVLRYLKGTADLGLVYSNESQGLHSYVDADWGNDIVDRKSYSGFVLLLGGTAVAWESKKQKIVSLSTTEAEYISLSDGAKETVFNFKLIDELIKNFNDNGNILGATNGIKMYCDNQSALALSNNDINGKRSKHIDIRYHYVKNLVKSQLIEPNYISTKDMLADFLTKPVNVEKHKFCYKGIGMKS